MGPTAPDILIGPETTVYALTAAYPFLEPYLLARGDGFEKLADPQARTRWARVTTLDDVAVGTDVTWRELVREIGAEVARETGRRPRLAVASLDIAGDEPRLADLRAIHENLEHGGSLTSLAERWREATGGLDPTETAALDAALLAGEAAAVEGAPAPDAETVTGEAAAPLPEGHPLVALRREAEALHRLGRRLQGRLDTVRPAKAGTWPPAMGPVVRLAAGAGSVELRFRRLREIWFPVLERRGAGGVETLLGDAQDEVLGALKRLCAAVDRCAAAAASEAGAAFAAGLLKALAQDERVLEPLAERAFDEADWELIAREERAVGWALIAAPPAWPGGSSPEPGDRGGQAG